MTGSTGGSAAGGPTRPLGIVLAVIAAVAIGVPALLVSTVPDRPARLRAPHVALPRRVVPPAELPPVEPVDFVDLSPEQARAYNATVPFAAGPRPAARAFRYAGLDADHERATDCLAAAVVYEAGDSAIGERAVAQVVLNRLRHPAFPKTVCDVVFEGAERSTGCQFTFTCDGALTRWRPGDAAWQRARAIAAAALHGAVYKPVGYATHYHTDWVVPYWQASLDKIARVESHLFFRWTGWWGTPPAFNRRLQPGEPTETRIAALSPVHQQGQAIVEAAEAQQLAAALIAGASAGAGAIRQPPGEPETFLATLDPKRPADSYKALALASCGDRPRCMFLGWTDPRMTATARPFTPAQIETMAFSYMREREIGLDRTLWNCQASPRADPRQCMRRLPRLPVAIASPTPVPAAETAEPLTGVRRRVSPTSAPVTTVTPPRTSPPATP